MQWKHWKIGRNIKKRNKYSSANTVKTNHYWVEMPIKSSKIILQQMYKDFSEINHKLAETSRKRTMIIFQFSPVHTCTCCQCECDANMTWIWCHNSVFVVIFAKELSTTQPLRIIRCEFVTSTFASHSHSHEVWAKL